MRLFDSFVEEVLDLFTMTYELRFGPGWARYERIALPVAGGIEEQPAKVMHGLAAVAEAHNTMLAREIQLDRARREQAARLQRLREERGR